MPKTLLPPDYTIYDDKRFWKKMGGKAVRTVAMELSRGFHGVALFTWGSVIFIGLGSKFYIKNIYSRITGSLLGATLFFIITNFGVWSLGSYGYTLVGLMTSYTLAIPFFAYSLISTFVFAGIIESVYRFVLIKNTHFFLIRYHRINIFRIFCKTQCQIF